MELNERDESKRRRIEKAVSECVGAYAKLQMELIGLPCTESNELVASFKTFLESMQIADDVLKCCKMPYSQYLNTDRWRRVRDAVMARDHRKCVECEATEFLAVHHLTYENRGLESLQDLVTLCDECHRKRHGKN